MTATIETLPPQSPMIGKRIELRHSYGLTSPGLVVGVEGRAGETLIILFDGGPLNERMARVGPLPRRNLQLEQPVAVGDGDVLSLVGGA